MKVHLFITIREQMMARHRTGYSYIFVSHDGMSLQLQDSGSNEKYEIAYNDATAGGDTVKPTLIKSPLIERAEP